jgi:hypothetical protein
LGNDLGVEVDFVGVGVVGSRVGVAGFIVFDAFGVLGVLVGVVGSRVGVGAGLGVLVGSRVGVGAVLLVGVLLREVFTLFWPRVLA